METWPLIGHSVRLLIGQVDDHLDHLVADESCRTSHITHYSDHNYAQPGSDLIPPSLNSRNTNLAVSNVVIYLLIEEQRWLQFSMINTSQDKHLLSVHMTSDLSLQIT